MPECEKEIEHGSEWRVNGAGVLECWSAEVLKCWYRSSTLRCNMEEALGLLASRAGRSQQLRLSLTLCSVTLCYCLTPYQFALYTFCSLISALPAC